MNKKALLAQLMYQSGFTKVVNTLSLKDTDCLRILAYHRVIDFDRNTFPFDVDLISATPESFRRQVEHVKKYYNPISFTDLIEARDRNRPLPKNSLIITFDDGFDDNYHFAFPILKQLGVPATFFISTDYIGSNRVYWFDWVVYLVKQHSGQDLTIHYGNDNFVVPAANAGKANAIKRLMSWMKTNPDENRLALIETLEKELGVTQPPAHEFELSRPMNWEQVREMANSGMEIGSHTRSHPILSQLQRDKLDSEIRQSKAVIEDKLNQPCPILAYPVGGKSAYNETVTTLLQDCGYEFACSYVPGINENPVQTQGRYSLKRLHVEEYTDDAWFANMLTLPKLFA